jgi:hypothetical protein
MYVLLVRIFTCRGNALATWAGEGPSTELLLLLNTCIIHELQDLGLGLGLDLGSK